MPDVITLSNLKTFLQIDHTDDDGFLTLLIPIITAEIQGVTHIDFQSISRTEWFDGGVKDFVVDYIPITSITSITDFANPLSGIVIPAADYSFNPDTGEIWSTLSPWGGGRRRWEVIYVGGRASFPADVELAAYQIATIVYETRNPSIIADVLGDSETKFQFDTHTGLAKKIRSALSRYSETGF